MRYNVGQDYNTWVLEKVVRSVHECMQAVALNSQYWFQVTRAAAGPRRSSTASPDGSSPRSLRGVTSTGGPKSATIWDETPRNLPIETKASLPAFTSFDLTSLLCSWTSAWSSKLLESLVKSSLVKPSSVCSHSRHRWPNHTCDTWCAQRLRNSVEIMLNHLTVHTTVAPLYPSLTIRCVPRATGSNFLHSSPCTRLSDRACSSQFLAT